MIRLKKVTAYTLPNGNSHPDKEVAAAHWLQHLSNAGWDYELPVEIARRMIQQRGDIIELLRSLDEVEADDKG